MYCIELKTILICCWHIKPSFQAWTYSTLKTFLLSKHVMPHVRMVKHVLHVGRAFLSLRFHALLSACFSLPVCKLLFLWPWSWGFYTIYVLFLDYFSNKLTVSRGNPSLWQIFTPSVQSMSVVIWNYWFPYCSVTVICANAKIRGDRDVKQITECCVYNKTYLVWCVFFWKKASQKLPEFTELLYGKKSVVQFFNCWITSGVRKARIKPISDSSS